MNSDLERGFSEKIKQLMHLLWQYQRVEIHDIDAGEDPFLYSTGNYGPGYTDIKGGVGFRDLFDLMTDLMGDKLILDGVIDIELVVGMMTGGALPGFRLAYLLSERWERTVHYVYQRGARKEGGHKELDTGDRNNLSIRPNCKAVVVEELVNFAGTTTNGVLYERNQKGRIVHDAACILFYQNPVAVRRLQENNINLHYVLTLPELLEFGVNKDYTTRYLADKYFDFLKNPKEWNESRGFKFYG